MSNPRLPIEDRLTVAIEIHRLGIKVMRQNLTRLHPGAPSTQIDELLSEWIRSRPADFPGRRSTRIRA